ncbi:MAG: Na(+)-translocating NADH-quinone reductase subunit A [Saprospiraceae bacterium]
MKTLSNQSIIAVLLILPSSQLFSQSSSSSGNTLLLTGLVIVSVILILWALLTLANNLMRIEAAKHGLDTMKSNFSVFPGKSDLFKGNPKFTDGFPFVKLKKGFDITLDGEPTKSLDSPKVNRFAIQPTDFLGMSPIPKVTVEIGQNVKAGDVLFYDKKREDIFYVSPVSGEVVAVERGEKRVINNVIILADKQVQYKSFTLPNIEKDSRETLVAFLKSSGLWPFINERPFDRVPDGQKIPSNIFISTFDSAPLAPDLNFIIEGQEKAFQKGLDVLQKLTSGQVHLGLDGRDKNNPPHPIFVNATGVVKTFFAGKHPSGNVGIQIHHTKPIKPGQTVWTLGIQGVTTIGNMFLEGKFMAERIVAISGIEVKSPQYVKTFQGCHVGEILKDNIHNDQARIISGDVLSGKQISLDGYLGFNDDQITTIKEGNEYELFGWLLPIKPRPSISGTFPNFLYPDHKFEADTNTHGEKRALVVTGQYEEVLPMDTFPQHLIKSIITNDLERMEGLGILELTEEDVALCEFVCTSKTPVQKILRQGLEALQEQS